MMAPGSAATGPGGTAEGKRGESSGGTRKTASPGAGAARGGSAKGKKGELKPPKGPPRGPYSMHAEDEPPMVRWGGDSEDASAHLRLCAHSSPQRRRAYDGPNAASSPHTARVRPPRR